jgi:DNA-binding XRE family transcriptional regulator
MINLFEQEMLNVFDTPWFSSIDSRLHPGENLRIYRENTGLTQAELGKKLGNISRQNISSMEKGKRGISKEIAKKLAHVLNAPIARFI